MPPGVIAALTTPFADGRPSARHLRQNLEAYLRTDLAGYLVLGSTGETVFLDESEKRPLIEAARAAVPRQRALLVGIDGASSRAAIRQAKAAGAAGADAVLASTPHYFRNEMTHEALVIHFTRVADAAPVPVLLYDVPKFTGLSLPPDTVVELSRHPNVAGIKESSGDLDRLRGLRSRVAPGFHIGCGSVQALAEASEVGADSAILAAAVAVPEPLTAIARLSGRGRHAEARELHARLRGLAGPILQGPGVAGFKATMDLRGLYGGPPRGPLLPVTHEMRARLDAALTALLDAGLIDRREL